MVALLTSHYNYNSLDSHANQPMAFKHALVVGQDHWSDPGLALHFCRVRINDHFITPKAEEKEKSDKNN
jgi:hypothetical protein